MVGFSAGGHLAIAAATSFVLMYLALKQAGVPAELHVYATAAHDFGVRTSDHPCSTWTEGVCQLAAPSGIPQASY